jgi:hypothetical protein
MFGGISQQWKSPLIAVDHTIDAISYCDDCIDDSGLIPGMNEVYGIKNWFLVQDGATCHTSRDTLEYLNQYINVLPDWPSGSPDMNPIENLWAITKRRIEGLRPATLEELVEIAFGVWELISKSEIDHLIDSLSRGLPAVVSAGGDRIHY